MMRKAAPILALLTLVLPTGLGALGLGSIEVSSKLNEPLEARIPLRAASPGDARDLRVSLASRDQFRRAGLERPFVLDRLQFQVQTDEAESYVRITTEEPVREPFLDFLVEINWPQGRVVREYTVLLDPPVYGAAISSGVREAVTTQDELPAFTASADGAADQAQAPAGAPAGARAGADTAAGATSVASSGGVGPGDTYGPVRRGETLWSLAERFRPDSSVSVQQTMLAMLRANPEAFHQGNINGLRRGAILRIPARDEIRAAGPDALAQVQRQNALWEEYRRSTTTELAQAPEGTFVPSATPEPDEPSAEPAADEPEPEDRLEVLATGTATAEGNEGGGEAEAAGAVREELNLAFEEADALRQEKQELESRLEETEALIQDLRRLVDLKDDNIAALQQRLAELEESVQQQAAQPAETEEPSGAPAADAVAGSQPGSEDARLASDGQESATAQAQAGAAPEESASAPEPGTDETQLAAAGTTGDGATGGGGGDGGGQPEPQPELESHAAPAESASAPEPGPDETQLAAAGTTGDGAAGGGGGDGGGQPEPQPEPESKPPLPGDAPPAPSFLESLRASLPMSPITLMGAAGGLIVLGGGWALMRRRRNAEEAEAAALDMAETDEAEAAFSEDIGEAAHEPIGAPAEGPESEPEPEPVSAEPSEPAAASAGEPSAEEPAPAAQEAEEDPLAEVNVYLAYERFEQAEELVRDAIDKHPDRHDYKLKLLEVAHAAKNTALFEQGARDLQQAVGDDSPLMQRARTWWQELSPGRELFEAGAAEENQIFDVVGTHAPIGEDTSESTGSSIDFDLGFESESAQEEADAATGSGLDFDLGFEGEPDEQTAGSASGALDFSLDEEAGNEGSGEYTREGSEGTVQGLDFSLEDTQHEREQAKDESSGEHGLDFDLSEIDASGDGAAGRPESEDELTGRRETGELSSLGALDFELGDESGRERSSPGGDEQSSAELSSLGGLDFELGDESGRERSSPGGDEQSSAELSSLGGLDFELGDEPASGDAPALGGSESTDRPQGDGDELDLALDEEASGSVAGTQGSGGTAADDEAFDLSGDFGEADRKSGQAALAEDEGLDFDLSWAEDEAQAGAEQGASERDDELELDLSIDDEAPEASDTGGRTGPQHYDTVQLTGEQAGGDEGLELDLDESLGASDESTGGRASSGLDLQLDEPASAASTQGAGGEHESEWEKTQYMLRDPESKPFSAPPPDADEPAFNDGTVALGQEDSAAGGEVDAIQTKLDLALAYVDMGDSEGARAILDEVMSEGNDSQKKAAEELLAKLG